MIPSSDDRIASIIRALSEVILPHLPPEASLAQEQTQLAIGQLQILRAQLDQSADFEQEELDDYVAIAAALRDVSSGGSSTATALKSIGSALENGDGLGVREQRVAVNKAVELLIDAVSEDGDDGVAEQVSAIIIAHEEVRSMKDRRWFGAFGFDTLPADEA